MEIEYSDKAEDDAREWIKSGNKKVQGKITRLIQQPPSKKVDWKHRAKPS